MAKNYKDFDDSDGVWRTVGGRRIFIRNGQDLASAMKESGKFKKKDKGTSKEASEDQLKRMQTEYKDVADLRDEYEDKVLSKVDEEERKEGKLKQKNDAQDYYSKLSEKEIKEDLEERKNRLDNDFYDEKDKEMYQKFYDEGKKYYDEKYGEAEVWEKQSDGTFLANKDAMKKQYEENHKNYDAKIKQFAEDRKNMTNGDWEGMLMAYEQQNADGTYKTLQDIMDDVDKYEKGNIRIEDKNGELTGYTKGERIEYAHSGSTGLMASVYSIDDGKLSGQQFEIPKEYQGDKLKDYSLKEIERLKSDKEAYDTRQKEGLDKFIQKSTNPFYPDNEYSKEDLDRMAENGIKPMDNSYSGRGWKGVNSDKHLSTSEQAKAITNAMKEKYSDVKISRKSDVYSGGSSIDFNIMSSDKDMYISDADIDKLGDEQLFNTDITRGYDFERWANDNIDNYRTEQTYSVDDVKRYAKETLSNIKNHENQNVRGNEWYLSDYGKKVVSDLNKEANSYTYDDSDSMTDYFNHGTYMNVSIGKWNKPYQVNQKSTSETKKNTIADAIARNNELNKKLASEGRTYDDYLIEKRTNGKYKTMDEVLDTAEKMSTNETMNKAIREKASKTDYSKLDNYEIYDKADALARETKDYTLKSEINKTLDKIDRANKRGSGYAEKPTNDLRKILSEVENGNENQITNTLKEKAYKKYLKEHPGSKMSFEDFKDMRKQ